VATLVLLRDLQAKEGIATTGGRNTGLAVTIELDFFNTLNSFLGVLVVMAVILSEGGFRL